MSDPLLLGAAIVLLALGVLALSKGRKDVGATLIGVFVALLALFGLSKRSKPAAPKTIPEAKRDSRTAEADVKQAEAKVADVPKRDTPANADDVAARFNRRGK